MLPLGNRTGTVRMLSLSTGRLVNRDQFRILPMPEAVIKRLNELALADGRVKGKGELYVRPTSYEQDEEIGKGLPDTIEPAVHDGVDPSVLPLDNPDEPELGEVRQYDDGGALIEREPDDADGHHVESATPERVEDADPEMDGLVDSMNRMRAGPHDHPQYSASGIDERGVPVDYTATAVAWDDAVSVAKAPLSVPDGNVGRQNIMDFFRNGDRTALLTRNYDGDGAEWGDFVFNISVNEALRTRGDAAVTVIEKELRQMIDKKVWEPIDVRKMSCEERQRIIRSSMFLKEKFLASGEFEKLKARLVAGGDQQDRDLYDDLSAPTVATSSVFTLLSIAAYERRSIAVVDISGAFLNADMTTGLPVHMRLDRNMSNIMIKLAPRYSPFADHKGCIVVKLDKALYGCVESAALWYENLRASLAGLGYVPNPHDTCVFNKHDGHGVQCTIAVHVDDLMITSTSSAMIESVACGLIKRYGDITRKDGPVVNYLGMVFDLTTAGVARVSMTGYVEDMLKESGTVGGARTPATEGLFNTREEVDMASEEQRVRFHRHVAKMLYLAKRARPDCLTAVAYLATRVTRCSVDDLAKLERLLKYVNATKDRGIVFAAGCKGIEISVLIDAAYGVHPDGKSHTGSCVVVGERGAVHSKSAKQQIVTKSSTEAELVALSDSTNQALHMRYFIIGQGHACRPVTRTRTTCRVCH